MGSIIVNGRDICAGPTREQVEAENLKRAATQNAPRLPLYVTPEEIESIRSNPDVPVSQVGGKPLFRVQAGEWGERSPWIPFAWSIPKGDAPGDWMNSGASGGFRPDQRLAVGNSGLECSIGAPIVHAPALPVFFVEGRDLLWMYPRCQHAGFRLMRLLRRATWNDERGAWE